MVKKTSIYVHTNLQKMEFLFFDVIFNWRQKKESILFIGKRPDLYEYWQTISKDQIWKQLNSVRGRDGSKIQAARIMNVGVKLNKTQEMQGCN